MAEGEDSRPFLVLKRNAEDFKAAFDRDIQTLLDTLDSKITDLLRNPESLASSATGAKRLNAHMEFSKAKLDIFVNMKDMIVDMEGQWGAHLEDLTSTFVENVEIFLAGTKLEVKEDVSSPAGNRKSLSLKERKKLQSSPTPVSSLYPKLLDTAKSIPVLNNLLPKSDNQSSTSEPQNVGSSPLLKPIRKQSALPELDSPGPGRRKNNVRFAEVENNENIEIVEEEDNDSDVEIVEAPALAKKRRGRAAANATTSLRKAVAIKAFQNEVSEAAEKLNDVLESPSRGGRGARRGPATPSSAKKAQATARVQNEMEISSDSSISGGEEVAAAKPRTRRGAQVKTDEPVTPRSIVKAKRGSKMSATEEVVTPVRETPGKRGRRAAAPEPVPASTPPQAVEASPKTSNFPHGLDLTEDLEIFSPVVNLTRSAPRRKTVILQDLGFTPEVPKPKSKRKTIGGDLSISSGTPSKRLKMSSRNSLVPEEMGAQESDDSDHLEGDNTAATGNYTPWVPLSDAGAKVPAEPGVYELKVSQAKKPAYIGACESLRQKLTLHRLRHGSGHKHLDKFVERNAANLLVRYERTESLAVAKAEEKLRVKSFVALHNTTPAYN